MAGGKLQEDGTLGRHWLPFCIMSGTPVTFGTACSTACSCCGEVAGAVPFNTFGWNLWPLTTRAPWAAASFPKLHPPVIHGSRHEKEPSHVPSSEFVEKDHSFFLPFASERFYFQIS